ncbi:MAG: ATP synthase F0 subunit B [Silvanigrellaceae bacterium]|nr:ATP synthase F0 subunit B [Silvanigrellaceae bacterium]
MAGSLDIYPFHDTEGAIRFGIQIGIFLVGVIVAQKLIIGPAIKLHNERKRRTIGATEASRLENDRAKKLEMEYLAQLKKGAEEAKNLRAQEISAAQKAANNLIAENQKKADAYLNEVRDHLSSEINQAKSNLPSQVKELVSTIYKKIGVALVLAIIGYKGFIESSPALAASGTGETSFWYSVFWPYFQFVIYIGALVLFARKPIAAMLDKNRNELRARLSEAKEASILAERKVKEYEAQIASLEKEIAELKDQSLFDAKIERDKIMSDAAKVSESILKDAERAAKELITRSKEEIRQELFNLALHEVEKSLTPEQLHTLDSKLKSETIDGIKMLN